MTASPSTARSDRLGAAKGAAQPLFTVTLRALRRLAAAPGGPREPPVRGAATLSYRYTRRKSANEALYGPSFDDRIRLHIEKGDAEATRTVRVELFGRERRRAAG